MATSNKTRRKKAWAWGRFAELLAVARLRCGFYRILATRYRTSVGEIDLIARRRDTIVFVEVKARRTISDGLESISPRQQQRIARAAQWFLQKHPTYAGHKLRFDAIIVAPWHWPRHVRDAWQANH